jgi:hypothetical protein
MVPRGEEGFVLADALVSLIVTSLVIGTLVAVVSRSALTTQRTGDQYRASSYAWSKLAELRAAGLLSEGQTQGRFDDLFSWTLTAAKNEKLALDHEAAPLVPLNIELKVSWRRGSHRYERVYRTILLRGKGQAGASTSPWRDRWSVPA